METALAQLPGVAALLTETVERFGAAWLLEAGRSRRAGRSGQGAPPDGAGPRCRARGRVRLRTPWRSEKTKWTAGSTTSTPASTTGPSRGAARCVSPPKWGSRSSQLAAAIDAERPWREVYQWVREERADQAADPATAFLEAIQSARQYAESHGLSASAAPLAVAELSLAARVFEPVAAYRPGGYDTRAAILLGEPEPAALPWLAARLGVPGVHLHRSQTDLLPRPGAPVYLGHQHAPRLGALHSGADGRAGLWRRP